MNCHENKESVKDTIQNIFKFNEEVCIIINDGTDEGLDDLVADHVHVVKRKPLTKNVLGNDVFLNYERFDTMVPLHLDLYEYIIENNIVSDYVFLMSSNQLFVNRGLYNFMKDYDASFYDREVDKGCISSLKSNVHFKKYYEELGESNFVYQSNHDGMFFKYEIFLHMMEYFIDMKHVKLKDHAEEFLYVAYIKKYSNNLVEFKKYNYWQPTWRSNFNPANLVEIQACIDEGYFLAKRVSREYNNDVRTYIRELK